MNSIARLIDDFAVKIHGFVENLDFIAAFGNDPLDEVLVGIIGEAEDYNIADLGVAQSRSFDTQKRNVRTVGEFIGKQKIPDQQSVFHGF